MISLATGQEYNRKCFPWRYTIHPAWCACECWFSLWLVLGSHNPVYNIYVMILLLQLLDQLFWRRICMNHVVLNGFCFMSLVFVREPETKIQKGHERRGQPIYESWSHLLQLFCLPVIWVSLDNLKVDKVRCGNPTIDLERIGSSHILITKSLLWCWQPQQKALSWKGLEVPIF